MFSAKLAINVRQLSDLTSLADSDRSGVMVDAHQKYVITFRGHLDGPEINFGATVRKCS